MLSEGGWSGESGVRSQIFSFHIRLRRKSPVAGREGEKQTGYRLRVATAGRATGHVIGPMTGTPIRFGWLSFIGKRRLIVISL